MKKRILFVDDERDVLDGLCNRLRRYRTRWDMVFLDSGQEALAMLARERFDVVISDMRMPDMDGPTLLRRVRENHPEVARIVLSGCADEGAVLRAVAIAHQFLPKPCEGDALEQAVERVCELQALIHDKAVRATIGKLASLPTLPSVYLQLMATLGNERASAEDVAKILKQDGALCAQILRIANSSYFGLSRSVVKIEEAVLFLGLATIRRLAFVAEVFRRAGNEPTLAGLSVEGLKQHSLLSGGIASSLFSDKHQKEAAFIAGLVHDIGKLLLASELPDRVARVVFQMRAEGKPMHAVEQELYGVTHAEVGAYLLGLWQLPFPIVEAVANHHAPARVVQQGLDVPASVYIADALAHEQLQHLDHGSREAPVKIDEGYLEKLGVAGSLPQWRELAKERARAQADMPMT